MPKKYATFQLKRTKKSLKNIDDNKLAYGEPLFYNSGTNINDVALVIGDGSSTPISELPKFTPTPTKTDNGDTFNNVYFIKKGDQYYLVDKDGNDLNITGGSGGSGYSAIATYTGVLDASAWVDDVEHVCYMQTVEVSGIQEKNASTIDVLVNNPSAYSEILSNWKYIIKADTKDNEITFYAYNKPNVNLAFQVQTTYNLGGLLYRLTAALTQTWTQEENYYVQEITEFNGLPAGETVKATDTSTIDLNVDLSDYKNQLQEWSKLIKVETLDGLIRVYASKPTTMSLPVQIFLYTTTSYEDLTEEIETYENLLDETIDTVTEQL